MQLIHRGKHKTLTAQQRRWLRRRQAIEPAIGHAKLDHRMDRCWLQGASGDALHAVLCAAGFNIRWLLRAIQAKGLKALFLALTVLARYGARRATNFVTTRTRPATGPNSRPGPWWRPTLRAPTASVWAN